MGTDVTGIPSNITLFYPLSEVAHPELQGLKSITWHAAASSDTHQLTQDQKSVFQNWARWAKVRLNAMFDEMDKQAFAQFNNQSLRDPTNQTYKNCLSNKDLPPPPCKNGLAAT